MSIPQQGIINSILVKGGYHTATIDLSDSQKTELFDEDIPVVKRAQNGDSDAFEMLIKKHEKKIFNIAYRMLADKEEAYDAAQESMLKIYRALPGFKRDSKFSTWAYRITSNTCLDIIRKRKNQREVSLDNQIETSDGKMDLNFLSDNVNVESEFERKELNQLILSTVEKMPDNHRAIIVMRDFQEMSYSEIAEQLDCPEGTIKSRINRARKYLRSSLLELKELQDYLNVYNNNHNNY